MPSESEVNLDLLMKSIIEKIPREVKIKDKREEPIAFGLKALILDLECEERDGVMNEMESILSSSELVGRVELVGVSRKSTTLK